MELHVNTKHGKGYLALVGRFDFNSHQLFREGYDRLLKDGAVAELEVDLRMVDYLDSSALGMLLLLRERAAAARKAVALANPRDGVREILEIANFGKLFPIRDSCNVASARET